MKRIIAFLLCIAMLASVLSLFASAVPYTPPATAFKDFGQEQTYIYEVKKGQPAPTIDGKVTANDGYGDPVETYSMRYISDSTHVQVDENLNPLPEYVMRADGQYYVYPTADSPEKVWTSITNIETSSDNCNVYTGYYAASWTASYADNGTYKYANPETMDLVGAYGVVKDDISKGTYIAKDVNGDIIYHYRLLKTKPQNWETTYTNYLTAQVNFVQVSAGSVPTWTEDTYYQLQSNGTYTLVENYPIDWKTNYKDYYTRTATYTYIANGSNPVWQPNCYYAKETINPKTLVVSNDGNGTTQVGTLTILKKGHVILPEEVRIYNRYDGEYLYEAIQIVEPNHTNVRYAVQKRYSVNMSNSVTMLSDCCSVQVEYSQKTNHNSVTVTSSRGFSRVNAHGYSALTADGYKAGVLAKYGNPKADDIAQVYTSENYKIGVAPYIAPVKEEADTSSEGLFADEDESEDFSASDEGSGTYGTTTYEYRQRWDVINSKYNKETDATPVPEAFSMLTWIQLENSWGNKSNFFQIGLPKNTTYLPGCPDGGSGNYQPTKFMFRYPQRTGLVGDIEGRRTFFWVSMNNTYDIFKMDGWTTDYHAKDDTVTYTANRLIPVCYTAGQEPSSDYARPEYIGTQLRSDNEKKGGFRVLVGVPQCEKDVKEVGILVAPSETVKNKNLVCGMKSVNYNSTEFTDYYGIVDGKWMNLTENASKYFTASLSGADIGSGSGASTYANDDLSYATWDTVGGLPTGIYKVRDVKADLNAPYKEVKKGSTQYALEVTGLYDDFDDFFTFYTIRPYIKYTDGTVCYGEYECKSMYYIACWSMQEIIDNYNLAYTLTGDAQIGLDRTPLTEVQNKNGEKVQVESAGLTKSYSTRYNKLGKSLYDDDIRLAVFRWYAVSQVNRQNKSSLRISKYADFSDSAQEAVIKYVDMLEYVFNTYIVKPEARIYY